MMLDSILSLILIICLQVKNYLALKNLAIELQLLFFILMMNVLLSSTEEAAAVLEERITNFDISKLQGEDVDKAVSLLCGGMHRLKQVKHNIDDSEMSKQLIKVFMTTSVPEFNKIFETINIQRTIDSVLQKTGCCTQIIQPEQLLKLAEMQYRTMLEAETWTGIKKIAETAFMVQAKELTCFNCSGNHYLSNCKEEKNKDRIALNKKSMMKRIVGLETMEIMAIEIRKINTGLLMHKRRIEE